VRESFNRFRQMPLERRQQLRQQWRQMTPEQRHRAAQGARGPSGMRAPGMRPPPPRHVPR
jgi:hypothetical protein